LDGLKIIVMQKRLATCMLMVSICIIPFFYISANAQEILLGKIELNALLEEPYQSWFQQNYTNYHPAVTEIPQLTKALKNKHIQVFMGTWCGDSRRELPRLVKLLDSIGFPPSSLEIIGVSNEDSLYKQSGAGFEKDKFVFRIPVIIVYDKNRELGRITESAVGTLEKDLLQIATGQPYLTNYHGAALALQLLEHLPNDNSAILPLVSLVLPQLKNSSELSAYGHVLLAQNQVLKAIKVFKLNAFCYSDEANTWKNLAMAYAKNTDIPASK
jgi:thiol-disulfide isomerase/thioredoxin